MPELPDILLYLHALEPRVVGATCSAMRVISPFVLRTFDPPVERIAGRQVQAVSRIGKRFVFDFGDDLLAVTHLMIAGRWRWSDDPRGKPPAKVTQASFVFDRGALHLVESSPKKRASIHLVGDRAGLAQFSRGGVDVLSVSLAEFAAALRRENHTLKRSLTDPRLFDGIGNAYSDEILHAAGLSPIKLTSKLTGDEISQLFAAARETLTRWSTRLRQEFGSRFPRPGDVTAFRPDFAVHGKFGRACPACGTSVQRIRYAESDTNYCPRCQTGGIVLADRSMSRLLKSDWPRSIEELEGGEKR